MLIGFINTKNDAREYTQGILSIGIMMAMEKKEKTLIINSRRIESSEVEQSLFHDIESLNYRGIDIFLRESIVSMDIKQNITNSTISLLDGKLDMLIGTTKGLSDNITTLIKVLPKLNEIYNNVLINIDPLNNELKKQIGKISDVTVINLVQSKQVISNALKQTYSNTFYLINHYDSQSMYTKKNISKILKVGDEQIGVIPYNIELSDSISKSQLILYFLKSRLQQAALGEILISTEKLQRRVLYVRKAI